jgi:hypothetical protein
MGALIPQPIAAGKGTLPLDNAHGCVVVFSVVLFI